MKYNVMLTYCNLLSFYMLLKLEGKEVKSHPVVNRLIHFKLLLEKLRPLDQKLTYQVDKMVRQAVMGEVEGPTNTEEERLKHRPNIEMMKENGEDSEEAGSEAEEGEQDMSGSESDISEDAGTKKLLGKRKKPIDQTSSEEEETAKVSKHHKGSANVYRVSKTNPIQYQDTMDKQHKREQKMTEHTKHKLNKSNYVKMLREDMDEGPQEVSGSMGMTAKSDYMKEMEKLEKVE